MNVTLPVPIDEIGKDPRGRQPTRPDRRVNAD
jgi:hypothetical protein